MIEVNNLTKEKIDGRVLKKVAKIVLKGENREGLELSIVFADEDRMKELNKKYRQKNKATDVLSFGYDNYFGEVVICPARTPACRQAGNRIAFLLVHGILHILGYNHREMAKKESFYYQKSLHAK